MGRRVGNMVDWINSLSPEDEYYVEASTHVLNLDEINLWEIYRPYMKPCAWRVPHSFSFTICVEAG